MSSEEKTERLKSALWHSIGQTIDAIASEQDVNATSQFMGALTELVWTVIRMLYPLRRATSLTRLENASIDVEAFTRYKRVKHLAIFNY